MSVALQPPPAPAAAREPHRLVPPECTGTAVPLGRAPVAFGRRFVVLLAAGFAWLGPAFWHRDFALMLGVWDALLLIAWALDLARLPGPGHVRVTRRWLGALAIRRPATIEYALEHDARTALRVELIDDAAAGLVDDPPAAVLVAGGAKSFGGGLGEARIEISPRERGDHALGRVSMRVESGLRLAQRRLAVDLPQTVRVYPDLGPTGPLTLAAMRSRQLEMERRRQRMAGVRREFEALRDWSDRDELRDVCWPATARRNRLVAKQWRAERSQTLWIVLDAGRLTGAWAGDRTRLDVAADAALRLARVADTAGDRVGLLVYGRRVQHRVPPGRGRLHLRALLEALAQARREEAEADHVGAALRLLARQRQRSLVVWITDVAETAGVPDVIDGARQIARHHLLLFMAMSHREVAEAAVAPPDDAVAMYRRAAALELSVRRESLLRGLRQRGALVAEAEPGTLATAAINSYLEAKERSRL